MYAHKDDRRSSATRQTRDILLQVLHEREPELGDHLKGVAKLALGVGARLELVAEQLDEIVRAAELHDVGKMAIPDEILRKPGPLTDEEWAFVRQHTIIGERILGAAPALLPVAKLVRASHEHYDGSGYPDGLAGDAIPLGARIVVGLRRVRRDDQQPARTGRRSRSKTRWPSSARAPAPSSTRAWSRPSARRSHRSARAYARPRPACAAERAAGPDGLSR